jgi:hypothetical protein
MRGRTDRTVANKHQRLTSWLRFAGIDKAILPPVPTYEETLPTVIPGSFGIGALSGTRG